MRKEVIIATIAGITIGILVAFGSWRANLALKQKVTSNPKSETVITANPKTKPTENTKDKNDSNLTLTNAEDFDVYTDSKLTLTGITKPNSLIAVSGESEDYILKSGTDGSFQQDVVLDAGSNQILFSVYTPNGDKIEKSLTVVYSQEFAN